MSTFSLTKALLALDEGGYRRATQSQFLRSAASGQVSKAVLGKWLANDRLYIHSYIRALGQLISFLDFPDTVTKSTTQAASTTRLLDWCISALANIRREEKFFIDVGARYGIEVNLQSQNDGSVPRDAKSEGLRRWEDIFALVAPAKGQDLPWLEAAVVFWGTEKCYLDAWSWAKAHTSNQQDHTKDQDGGAVRKEFIDNWTSDEFVKFVDELGRIIDAAVDDEIKKHGEESKERFLARAYSQWWLVLIAEQAFWPVIVCAASLLGSILPPRVPGSGL